MGVDGIRYALNLERAVKYFERAAEAGEVDAMEALAEMYQHGHGVRGDTRKARTLFEKAATARFSQRTERTGCEVALRRDPPSLPNTRCEQGARGLRPNARGTPKASRPNAKFGSRPATWKSARIWDSHASSGMRKGSGDVLASVDDLTVVQAWALHQVCTRLKRRSPRPLRAQVKIHLKRRTSNRYF